MNGKEFFKNEPLLFKVIYLIGVIFLFVNLNDLTSGKEDMNLIFPIVAFATLGFFFVRMAIFVNNSDD